MLNKYSEFDYKSWGMEAADAFLARDIPMNGTISKIASLKNLNYNQISRVVEEANSRVFLQKHASTDDKYIEFDVADAKKIVEGMVNHTKEASETLLGVDDYMMRPSELFPKKAVLEDVGFDFPEMSEKEKRDIIYATKGIGDAFEVKMAEIDRDFQHKQDSLFQAFKTAALNPAQPEPAVLAQILVKFAESTYEDESLVSIADGIATEMVKRASELRIPVGSSWDKLPPINGESGLVQALDDAVKTAHEYREAYIKGPDFSELDEKYPSEKTAEFKSKATAALLSALAGMGVVALASKSAGERGYEEGKAIQAAKMSPLNGLPKKYNPMG